MLKLFISSYKNQILIIIILFSIFSKTTFGQIQRTYNWHFGDSAALTFALSSPQPILNSSLGSFEGSASISDTLGNLLFYTNGGGYGLYPNDAIWNSNNTIMPNGNLPLPRGCNSAAQSSIIIPRPGTTHQYYLFTVDCQERSYVGGLRYSLIDMSLDGGLGDIDSIEKNVVLVAPTNESLTGTLHANGTDYWIITHKLASNEFYVYLVTNMGVQLPLIFPVAPNTSVSSTMKISPLRNKISYSHYLYDFDPVNGAISVTDTLLYGSIYRSFSSNGKYLYIGSLPSNFIYQFDVTSSDIISTATLIGIISGTGYIGSFQLAPDNNIYIAIKNSPHLAAIECANDSFPLCSLNQNLVNLGGRTSNYGLPNFIDYYLLNQNYSCGLVNTKQLEKPNSINIFPNPTNRFFTVTFPISTNLIQIYDSKGQLFVSKIIRNKNNSEFELSNSGIYYVRVITEEGSFMKKIVVHSH